MLERWLRLALRDQALGPACAIYAHLALRFKNYLPDDLDAAAVYVLQVAQVFLNIHHRFKLDATTSAAADASDGARGQPDGAAAGGDAAAAAASSSSSSAGSKAAAVGRSGDKAGAFEDTGLGIPETEMFDLFQRFRHVCLKWLAAHPAESSDVMESIVKVVTLMDRGKGLAELISGAGLSRESRSGASAADHGREWRSLTAHHCFGRFVPDTESRDAEPAADTASLAGSSLAAAEARGDALADAAAASGGGESFEAWLRRVTTMGVGTEINVQLGEFTMKKHRMVNRFCLSTRAFAWASSLCGD
jgi:hypothetical protein